MLTVFTMDFLMKSRWEMGIIRYGTDKLTLAVIKFNGKWCIYDGREDGVRLATGMDSLADNDILWDIYNNYIKTVR